MPDFNSLSTLFTQQMLVMLGVCTIAGYLFGSISTAIITCKLMGLQDPRTVGSNNPGATNVLRFGGKKAAIITLLGDALKGLIPVLISLLVAQSLEINTEGPAVFAGLGAFFGHLYPVFFGFKGGKGVATAFGVILGLSWPIFLLALATWLLVATVSRYSALGALSAFALTPVYAAFLIASPLVSLAFLLISIMVFIRHKQNIRNLIRGEETKIGSKT